ncbi:alanine racemase [Metabacillus sp. GX 13764]|uniref:alanine racemase n=1 Tax=Metabacillus kandeliae TaxID=2900151 RepID=UPI001E398F57|nr:alanine racemase [Metabacillus kandeliae]MCD7034570.1 alanine racemase [Metabacillus kandeliae]
MFIEMMQKRNEGLIRSSVKLHQEGAIPPNTYVIDADALEHNVNAISMEAKRHDLNLYYMTKQIGRSGFVGKLIERNGIEQAVAVDIDEAYTLSEAGCRIGNVGHIVQPGKNQWEKVLRSVKPEVVTLFSYERAKQLSDAAQKLGTVQNVILRVIKKGDMIYPGQFGGFSLENLVHELPVLMKLGGIHIKGVTSFPALKINEEKTDYVFTSNMATLQAAAALLENTGIRAEHINAPGATSCYTAQMLKQAGVTHGEPGHALTGTTPLHAVNEHLAEIPSIVYVSEISHLDDQFAYTIAGGFYTRSQMESALYGSSASEIVIQKTSVSGVSNENIDYYGSLLRQENMKAGDTAIYAFRTQIFVTRAHVAYIRKANTNQPEVVYFQQRGR